MRIYATGVAFAIVSALLHSDALAVTTPPLMLATLNGPDYLVAVDRATGQGTRIGPLNAGNFEYAVTSLAYDGVRNILYGGLNSTSPTLLTIDPTTGQASAVGALGSLGFRPLGMAYDFRADILYGAGGSGGPPFNEKRLYTINPTSGTSTLLGTVAGISDSIQDLAYDARTGALYGLDEYPGFGARIVAINPATLTAAPVSATINASQNGWNGLVFDPFTGDLFANSNTTMYRINPTTGAITTVGLIFSPQLDTYGGLTVLFPVPEPSTPAALLLAISTAGASVRVRRGRK